MQDFKQIQAWRRAHALAIRIDGCARAFPRVGYGALRSQLTRAASSVPANIVDGCGSPSRKDFARFLDIAIKSLNETEYHLLAARDHGLLPDDSWRKLTAETIEIRKMLFGYRRKLLT